MTRQRLLLMRFVNVPTAPLTLDPHKCEERKPPNCGLFIFFYFNDGTDLLVIRVAEAHVESSSPLQSSYR